jgi:predicted ATPase
MSEPDTAKKPSRLELSLDRETIADSKLPDHMKDVIGHLPEKLVFAEPVTLIVGENGAGKTSLARAILGTLSAARQAIKPDGRHNALRLHEGEPAEAIATAIKVSDADAAKGNILAALIDGTQITNHARQWAEGNHRQSREVFNTALTDLMDIRVNQHRGQIGGDVWIVLDEPEIGLSPRGQLRLEGQVANLLSEGDTMIVPTNSLGLFCSDLPRIDLDYPERGVHRPSDYGERSRIELVTASSSN